jgi:hypothetical protein
MVEPRFFEFQFIWTRLYYALISQEVMEKARMENSMLRVQIQAFWSSYNSCTEFQPPFCSRVWQPKFFTQTPVFFLLCLLPNFVHLPSQNIFSLNFLFLTITLLTCVSVDLKSFAKSPAFSFFFFLTMFGFHSYGLSFSLSFPGSVKCFLPLANVYGLNQVS